MNKTIFAAILAFTMLLSGGAAANTEPAGEQTQEETAPVLYKITPEEAKEMLDSSEEEEIFLLDVRTVEEYDSGHIPGAVCIPDTELEERKDELPEDPATVILVYCRSGRRSAASVQVLAEMGYLAVYDFGGIIDWPYETEITAQEQSTDEDHAHNWTIYDCDYLQCTECGKLAFPYDVD